MRLIIEIDTENDAFVSDPVREIERLLTNVVRFLGQGDTQRALIDANGNLTGIFSYGP